MLPIPKWERRLSYFIWISHSFAAFLACVYVSRGPISQWITHWLSDSSYLPSSKMDLSDMEWNVYRQGVHHLLAAHAVHSLLFHLITKFSPFNYVKYLLILAGFACQIFMTSVQCIALLALFSLVLTVITYFSRSKVIVWIVCISFIINAPKYVPFTTGPHTYYREFNVYLYGSIKILNFCLFLCKNPSISYRSIAIDHLLYMAYLPYAMSLIVIFEDFRIQIHSMLVMRNRKIRETLWFGMRILFWFFAYEAILHFVHVHSLFNSPFTLLSSLNNYQLAAVAYVVGQLFHVKYVVIFGLPSFFSYLDGMVPPPPPICISRVSRYSRMWRHFDNGLYQFLKHQVYIPLMTPKLPFVLSLLRSLLALVAVFGVVIAWHGARPHFIAWVSLSALELIIERMGIAFWSTEYGNMIRSQLRGQNSRRLIALSMLATVIPGIFGVFFFLGQEGIGATIFERVLIQGVKDLFLLNIQLSSSNAAFVLIHMLTLGYFFNNVCLDLDQDRKKKTN